MGTDAFFAFCYAAAMKAAALRLAVPLAAVIGWPSAAAVQETGDEFAGFACPESLPDEASRAKNLLAFIQWAVGRHPELKSAQQMLSFRRSYLERHGCAQTLKGMDSRAAAEQRLSSGSVDDGTVTKITKEFQQKFKSGGMKSVSADIAHCYDIEIAGPNRVGLARCMLYDVAAMKFHRVMGLLFESRGIPLPSDLPFLTERAFGLRMQIYTNLVFGGSQTSAARYLADGPDRVVQGLNR
ncbi:MAG: hypothetical protein WDN25_03790 [Acetobacteraceae bacterium]